MRHRSTRGPAHRAACPSATLVISFLVALACTACDSPAEPPQPVAASPQATPTLAGVPPGFVKPTPLPTPLPGPELVVSGTEPMTFEDDTITAYDFADDDHGWVAVGSTILATQNGGQHWAPLYASAGRVSNLRFISPTKGWATVFSGGHPVDMNGITTVEFEAQALLTTDDGGTTWRPIELAP